MKYKQYFLLIAITLMMSVNLFATDIYLPALPEMAKYFNCSQTEIQLSFTVFLLGLAGCQLVVGSLSDHFGRKKVALVGFTLFTVSSLLCANAASLWEFNFFRLVQAIGSGVGSVIGRALIADRYNRQDAVKVFSTIFPIVGLSAAIGPFIGGYLTYFWDWRANFYFISGFGVVIVVLVSLCLNLKNERQRDSGLITPTWTVKSYFNVIGNFEFLAYALMICACFCVFRSYSVESPFVFSAQGYAPEEIGNFYISLSLAYLVGNLAAKKLINRLSLHKVVKMGISLLVVGGICLVGSAAMFTENPYAIIIPMSIITLGNGFLFPLASAGAMTSVRGESIGTASGIMGAMQFILAAACTNWVGVVCHGEAIFMSIFMGGIIVFGLFSYVLLSIHKRRSDVQIT